MQKIIIMLIYFTNRRNFVTESTQKKTSSTVFKELETLKLVIKELNKSQTTVSITNCASLYSFMHEDAEAYCITSIKNLLRTIEPKNLSKMFRCNTISDLIKYLVNYGHHPDIMIRNAARISLISIFQKSESQMVECVVFEAISIYLKNMLKHVKKVALGIQNYYQKSNTKAMKMALCCYQEEFEYIDDILKLNLKNKNIVILQIMRDFIFPFIFTSIFEDQTQNASPICKRIGLCLLSAFLESITDKNMKECITKIFSHKRVILTDLELKEQQINMSLHLILLKEKTNVDTILVLNIFHKLTSSVLNTNASSFEEFLYKCMHILMQVLKINYHSKPLIQCLRLKLIISILQPLTQKNSTHGSKLAKLKNVYLRNLEILYDELLIKIRQNVFFLPNIIDKEYEVFTHIKMDISKLITDEAFFEDDVIMVNNIIDRTRLQIHHLFCIRFLYLELKGGKENCLPLIKRKEEIGKTINIDCSVPCEKFIGGSLYKKEHFVKMTDRQLLILQNTENKIDGIIVFNTYYKDIIYSVNKNNTLKISDITKSSPNECEILSKPFSILIKFANTDDLKFVADTLKRAKETQLKRVKRKLEKLLFEKV